MDKPTSLRDYLGYSDSSAETPADAQSQPAADERVSRREFCRKVLASQEYRDSLYRRIVTDELPPAIESLLYHYAYGKPAERIEHTGKDGKPIEQITEVRRVIVHATLTGDALEEQDEAPPLRTH